MTPRKLLVDSMLIGLPVLLSRAIGLVMLPIYTRAFSPEDLGFIETLVVLLTFFQIFSTLESGQALARFLPEAATKARQAELISAALGIFIAGGAITLIVSAFFAMNIFKLIGIPPQYANLLPYVAFYLVTSQIFYFFQTQFIYRFEAKKSAIINFSATALIAVSSLTLFLEDNLTVKNFLLAQAIGYSIGVIISLSLTHAQGIKLHAPRAEDYISILRFSLPLLISSFAVLLASSFDKILISKLIGLNELGYYSVATRLATIASIAFQVFGNIITPHLYNPQSESNARKTLSYMFGITCAGTLISTLILILVADSIANTIATDSYAASAHYLAPAFLIAVTGNLYRFFPDLDIFKRTKLIASINIMACALGCGIAFAAIDLLGTVGIILGRFISGFGMGILYWYFSNTEEDSTNKLATLLVLMLFPIGFLLWWLAF